MKATQLYRKHNGETV